MWADNSGNRKYLIEPPRLSVPLLDRVERRLAREVEHEEDRDGVVAHERQHVHELALAPEVPERERDRRASHGDGLLHEVHACAT